MKRECDPCYQARLFGERHACTDPSCIHFDRRKANARSSVKGIAGFKNRKRPKGHDLHE